MSAATKASSIGWMFVPQYYTFVNKDPGKLHCFYTKKSTLIHGVEGEECQPCYGQQEIHEKIMSLGFEDCKVFVSTVDSQSSAENGIVVQVVGELSNNRGPWRKFAQTFFLAEQPNGYFVLNDIFRYIKEESDEEEEEALAATTSSSAAVIAPADVLATLDQPIHESALHHAFELAQAHGAPEVAAGVIVAPPIFQQADVSTRATLAGLVNGDASQEHVVELHDEINQEQPQQSGHVVSHAPPNGNHIEEDDATEIQAAEPELASTSPSVEAGEEAFADDAEPEQSLAEATAPQVTKPSEEEVPQPKESTTTASQEVQPQSPAPSTEIPVPTTQAPPPAATTPAPPSKPQAPKTWASLAATNSNAWKQQVVSDTRGISSSKPASKVPPGAATPAAPVSAIASSSASAAPPSEQGSNDGFITAGPRRSAVDRQHDYGDKGSDRNQTRTPAFSNIETDFSIVLSNCQQGITHSGLRQKLSDEFARTQAGGKKDWAKLSYLDIDRSKAIAYVDFEEEWALKRAVDKGSCEVDGINLIITAGKGQRRDASTFSGRGGDKRGPSNSGRGRGAGGMPQQGERRGPGGPGRGASNGANAAKGGARASSGRGQ